jgi:hypothetical protein
MDVWVVCHPCVGGWAIAPIRAVVPNEPSHARGAIACLLLPPPLLPFPARVVHVVPGGRQVVPGGRLPAVAGALLAAGACLHALLRLPCTHAAVSPGERQGLVNLYTATDGPSWQVFDGWHNHVSLADPCEGTVWTGVSCLGTTSITSIYLEMIDMSGTLPSNWGTMSALTRLDFTSNLLVGFPTVMSGLPVLQELLMRHNWVGGSFPSMLSGLSSLTILSLNENRLSGSFPSVVSGVPSLA